MRTIQEIIDNDTEESIKADAFFAEDEADIFKQRSELEKAYLQHKKLWVCPYCRHPVKIRGRKDGIISMHFAHFADRSECPIKTEDNYTREEILRIKYNGQKEGQRHETLKKLIAEQISRDGRFTDIKVERRFEGICRDWRKPDVSAIFNGKKVVFELQLNTTFLSVITERNLFYQDNQTYILWTFDHKRKNIDMRFMEKDIFYPNHHNAFFIDEHAQHNQFSLLCGYERPSIVDGLIKNEWQLEEINFGDLTFSPDYRAFWFDYEKQKKSLLEEIERNRFLEFGNLWRFASYEERERLLERYRLILDQECKDFKSHELSNLLNALYSIKFKQVIGYNYAKVIQVLHQYIATDSARNHHFGELVLKAINVYSLKHINDEDRTKKFRSKASAYREKKFAQCDKYDPFLKRLFPELFY